MIICASRVYSEGDRILVGVSGGKDSLTLVNVLLNLQKKAPIHFDVAAVTVDPQTPEYDPSVLKVYFKALGIPYFYESQPILDTANKCMDKKRVCKHHILSHSITLYHTGY